MEKLSARCSVKTFLGLNVKDLIKYTAYAYPDLLLLQGLFNGMYHAA
jgi:hypothetical protein